MGYLFQNLEVILVFQHRLYNSQHQYILKELDQYEIENLLEFNKELFLEFNKKFPKIILNKPEMSTFENMLEF